MFPFTSPDFLWNERCSLSVLISVALRAERDQVLSRILPSLAPMLDVVDLQVGSRPTGLTSPRIAPQDLGP